MIQNYFQIFIAFLYLQLNFYFRNRAISSSLLNSLKFNEVIRRLEFTHGKNNFAEVSENLARYRSQSNFVRSSN